VAEISTRATKQFENREQVQPCFRHEGGNLHELGELGTIRAAFGAVAVLAIRAKAVERGDGVPKQISIAQTTSAATLIAAMA
jgi:hypothetical protein